MRLPAQPTHDELPLVRVLHVRLQHRPPLQLGVQLRVQPCLLVVGGGRYAERRSARGGVHLLRVTRCEDKDPAQLRCLELRELQVWVPQLRREHS